MRWTYRATEEDLEAIRKGIRLTWCRKINYLFENKELIKNVNVLSFDSDFLYLWAKQKNQRWQLKKIKHQIYFNQNDQQGWRAGLLKTKMYQYLPRSRKNNFAISGSLLTPFLNAHQTKNSFDAYSTRASYLATIIHEFAHVYYRNFIYHHYYSRAKNVSFLKIALNLSSGKENDDKNLDRSLSLPDYLSEIFAFCVEYQASETLFPEHKNNMDESDNSYIKHCLDLESHRKVEYSPIFETHDDHLIAMVFGRIILNKYPKTWPKRILKATFKI